MEEREYKGGIKVFKLNDDWWVRTSWAGQYEYVIVHRCPNRSVSSDNEVHHTYWIDHDKQTCWGCHFEIPSEIIAVMMFLSEDSFIGRNSIGDACSKCC